MEIIQLKIQFIGQCLWLVFYLVLIKNGPHPPRGSWGKKTTSQCTSFGQVSRLSRWRKRHAAKTHNLGLIPKTDMLREEEEGCSRAVLWPRPPHTQCLQCVWARRLGAEGIHWCLTQENCWVSRLFSILNHQWLTGNRKSVCNKDGQGSWSQPPGPCLG